MAPIFKFIRRKLMEEGKVGRYLAYALGEIILIILGVVIALYLNNRAINNSKKKDINLYYVTILNELKRNKDHFETHYLTNANRKIEVSKQILEKLNSDNIDSLEKNKNLLYELVSLDPLSSITSPFLSLEEFKNKYLTEIQDDSIKIFTSGTIDGYLRFHSTLISTEKDLVLNSIIPILDKNINASEIISQPSDKEYFIKGGPKSNYSELFKNLEFYNLITHYQEISYSNKFFFEAWIKDMELFIQYLEKLIKENES